MSRRAALWPLVMAALLAAISASQAATVFLGATVIDGTGAPPLDDGAVVVDAGRIVAIRPRADVPGPAGADIVDLTGRWIIPGLIDAHIHFFQSGGLYTRPDIMDLRRLRPYAAERAMASATIEATFARYLASGITGVVDVGGPMENFAIRARGIRTALSPRIAVAGPLLATYAPLLAATIRRSYGSSVPMRPARRELAGDDPPIVRIKRADEARGGSGSRRPGPRG